MSIAMLQEARESRERQVQREAVHRAYLAAECLTYGAETVIEAGHLGKAGVILGIAANVLVRARYQAATGGTSRRTSRAKPSQLVTFLRNIRTVPPDQTDRLAEALCGAGTTSRSGLARVIAVIRGLVDELTSEGGAE